MDRLFKKRTNSVKDPRRAPSRQNSADEAMPTASSSKLSIRTTGSTKRSQKGRAKLDNAGVTSPVTPGSGSSAGLPSSTLAAPPSLDMDFRHSLLLPGLSQRFSVLLPSLSSIPERSLRPLLASQRQRNDLGPAITEEEEEMIFAELQDLAQTQKKKLEQWAEAPADNPVWSTMNLARWEHGANIPSAPTFSPQSRNSALSGSSSTPNLLHEATSAPLSIIGEQLALSSPPTSTSFDSLSTVGSNGSGGKEKRDERAMARSRGYGGFGGGARMQEDAYLRRSRKESERNLSTSMSSRSISGISQASSDRTERTDDTNRTEKGKDKAQEPEAQHRLERKAKGLSPISPELANADWKRKPSANSPTASERTATPTSAVPGPSGRRKITRHSPASSLSLNLPPQPPVPTSPPPEPPQSDAARQTVSAMATGRAPKQRKSMLSVLSDAQLKRISLALFEIGKELEAMGIKTTDDTDEEGEATSGTKAQGKEEILESVGDAGEPRDMDNERERIDSFKSQSESGHSTGSSSVFPYHVSPTTSSFATVPCDTTGAGARIPASPKVLDLHAQISHPKPMDPLPPPEEPPLLRKQSVIIQEGARPKPILTPTRTLPAKHVPSDSFDGSTPASALAIPGYIPGQMRPVGSAKSDSSSRSGTPNATSSIVPQDHTPIPALRQMTVSPLLARSQSVQTGSARQTPTAQHQRNVSLGQPITDSWRSASPLAQMSRTSAADIEEEDELPDAEQVSGDVSPRVPSDEEDIVVQQVVGKHSVARSRSDAKQRQKAQVKTDTPMSEIGETSSTPSLLDVPNETRARVTSHQAHIEGGSERSVARSSQARPSVQSICELAKGDDKPTTQPVSPRNSIGSSFHGKYEGENELDDYLQTPEMDPQEIEAVLGVSRETMEAMQDMLVMKAKAEREAFRAEMGDSPAMVMSPSMSASDLPAVPVQMRTMSPLAPAVARAITPVHRESEASRASGEVQTQGVQAEGTRSADLDFKPAPTMSTPPAPASVPVLPSAPVPGERSASGSQSIASASVPPSIPASRKPSHSSKVAPEDDPDVVRDFEARIAAATAALQRQPSVSGPSTKLERKGTKRGAMKISSPTLVSSSSSISGAILSPPLSGPGAATPPSSFKPAKPAHKMSLKWKNAFKRGPSISSSDKDKGVANPAVFSPPAYDSAPTSRNVSATSAVTTASSQTSTSGAVQQGTRQSEGSAKTPQRSLGDFRFPSSEQAPMSAGVSAAEPAVVPSISSGSVRSVLGRMKRGKSDEAPLALDRGVSPASTMIGSAGHASHADHRPPPQATASAPAVQQLKQAEASSSTSHRSNPSDDSAVAKFIAAGRALGLDNEQMNEMLAAKGMLNRSGSSRSNGSAALTGGSTASHTSPSPVTPATGIVVSPLVQSHDQPAATDVVSTPTYPDRQREGKERNDMPLTKKEGLAGLVRALSKKRAPKTDSEKEERHKVVRRTILMPESTSFNTLPRDSFASPQRSPRSQVSFSAQQPDSPAAPSFERTRNNSIRRKPIAMTPEEEEMLSASGSPVAPGRRVSMGNTSNPGLGFLAPESAERRPSGASGQSGQSGQSGLSGHESVYDMYGNESMAQSQQGIEIKEYEDGRIVWNVLDGLRGDEESESDYTQSGDFSQSQFQPHSREASFASDRSVDVGNKALSKEYKLPLRHRDRGANEPRPQTNLYFTSPTDVADLIDQLSQDPSASGKGRIDFTLPSPPPVPDLPAFTAHRTPPLAGKASNTGQFEDAPSPNRRTPPAPINVNRANQAPAGGWSPQRQARLRQAFGRAPAPTSSGVKAQQYVTPPGSTTPNSATSPGADSMNSLGSPAPGQGQSARNVEDRLQALMDRLVKSGAVRQG